MGILDLPGPLLGWIDGLLGFLPGGLRLVLWGVAGGIVSMWLYRAVSPQERIARGKQEQRLARERLDTFEGELAEAWPLIAAMLAASFRQVGRILMPAVIGSLPVLCVMVWASTSYGRFIPDQPVQVQASPESLAAHWAPEDGMESRVVVTGSNGTRVISLPLTHPVPVIERRHWWNTLIGNPAGYLPATGPVERVRINLPRREYLPLGPGWMRGWEFTFFTSLIVASLLLKRLLRIE